jgi:mutator protein MutT
MDNRFPVSVKGIIVENDRVILLKNERDEWELPGGRLEIGEDPLECVVREIREELGLMCRVERIVDTWVYQVHDRHVFIVTYICRCDDTSSMKISHEHKEARWISLSEINELHMPSGL